MLPIAPSHYTLSRSLLIASFLVFAAGASLPALDNFWGMSQQQGLIWIAAHPGKWALTSILFIASLVLCTSGLAIFNHFLPFGAARLFARIGFLTYFMGALLWIMVMAFRLSLAPWAAQILVETASLPDSFTPLSLLESTLFDIFMLSTFLASSLYGLALLVSQRFPLAIAWFSILYGLIGALSYAFTRGPIPIMVLIVPLVLGISPLPSSVQQK